MAANNENQTIATTAAASFGFFEWGVLLVGKRGRYRRVHARVRMSEAFPRVGQRGEM